MSHFIMPVIFFQYKSSATAQQISLFFLFFINSPTSNMHWYFQHLFPVKKSRLFLYLSKQQFASFCFSLKMMLASYRGKQNIFLSMPDSGLIFEYTSLLWQGYIVSGIRNGLYCTGCCSIILRGFWKSMNTGLRRSMGTYVP